ncbi:MAG: type IV pilus twitching motility protein PilT [Polyangiales bacterium]
MVAATGGGLTVNLHQLLKTMIDKGASDLHITTGSAPLLRIDGQIVPLRLPPLTPIDTKQLIYAILTEEQKVAFEKNNELDLSFGVKNLSRFRCNVFMQRGALAAALRAIPFRIMPFDELGLPPIVAELCSKPRGMVLVTGATGSGKSTTLATMVDKINTENRLHIMTVEDPIEFLHPHKMCLVNQREVGADTASFKIALKYILRQDPDVVLVGEMRDLETIEAALTIAETGHLVFATLHTNSCAQTINRIIDVFPANQQQQIRAQLSFTLQGVISQTLMPRMGQPGRCLAMEIMVPNSAIRNLIREDKIHQIYSQMQVGQERFGMQTFNQSLFSLITRRLISVEEGMGRTSDTDELKGMLERGSVGTSAGGMNRPQPTHR